jgi:hypothetical protein
MSKSKRNWIIAIAAGGALVAGIAIHSHTEAGGHKAAASASAHIVGIPGSAGFTVSQLTSDVSSYLKAPAPHGMGVAGVASVSCIPPKSWTAGVTFTCYPYRHYGEGIGTYKGTVLPDSADNWQWNADWVSYQ